MIFCSLYVKGGVCFLHKLMKVLALQGCVLVFLLGLQPHQGKKNQCFVKLFLYTCCIQFGEYVQGVGIRY